MKKVFRLALPAVLLLGLIGAPARADVDLREDPQEYEGLFDIASVKHSHGTSNLRHTITMHEAWADEDLRHGSITLTLRQDDWKRTIEVRMTNALKANLYDGNKKLGAVTVQRPDEFTVRLVFSPSILDGGDSYRWHVATTWTPECEEEPCPTFSDRGPDRGNITSEV